MDPSESLVQDTRLNAKVDLTGTEHVFNRHGRQGGRREIWHRKRRLGHGSFGTVWLENCDRPYRRDTPQLRAVKEIHLEPVIGDRAAAVDYTRELLAFAKFSQPKFEPFFVRSFGWFATADSVYITMAYHPLGDLQQYLAAPLPEDEVRIITEQLLEGLKHMHDNGFAHRDLKPKNVLVVSQAPDWGVQITDFGITKKIQDGQTAQATLNQGSLGFMAPEMIIPSLKGSHFAVDVWSLGSMAYFMLTNRLALADIGALYTFGKGTCERVTTDYADLKVSLEASDFIVRCMARKPDDRPKVDDALSEPWMSTPSHEEDQKPDDILSARLNQTSISPDPSSGNETSGEEMGEYYDTWTSKITADETQRPANLSPATDRVQQSTFQETTKRSKPDRQIWSSTLNRILKDDHEVVRSLRVKEMPGYGQRRFVDRKLLGIPSSKSDKSASTAKMPAPHDSNGSGPATTLKRENGTVRRAREKDDTGIPGPRSKSEGTIIPPKDTDHGMSAGRIASKTPEYLAKGIRALFFDTDSDKSPIPAAGPSKVRIEIRPWTRKLIICEMFLYQTVLDIKQEVQRQRGLPEWQQRLFLQSPAIAAHTHLDRMPLPDTQCVANLSFGPAQCLYLEVGHRLRVPDLVNKTMRFDGVPERIFIQRYDRTVFAVKVALNKPVLEIKKEIEWHEDLPVKGQKLIFAGMILADEAPAEEYGIVLDQTVYLVRSSGY